MNGQLPFISVGNDARPWAMIGLGRLKIATASPSAETSRMSRDEINHSPITFLNYFLPS